MPADPLPLRWTVVLWDGTTGTLVAEHEDGPWWRCRPEGALANLYTPRAYGAEGAVIEALEWAAPYRRAYPEGQDPVALERERAERAEAEVARLRAGLRELAAWLCGWGAHTPECAPPPAECTCGLAAWHMAALRWLRETRQPTGEKGT